MNIDISATPNSASDYEELIDPTESDTGTPVTEATLLEHFGPKSRWYVNDPLTVTQCKALAHLCNWALSPQRNRNADNGRPLELSQTERVDIVLDYANRIMRNHGIEAVTGEINTPGGYYQNIVLLYSNAGDGYAWTLLYEPTHKRFSLGSWGDFVELASEYFGIQ